MLYMLNVTELLRVYLQIIYTSRVFYQGTDHCHQTGCQAMYDEVDPSLPLGYLRLRIVISASPVVPSPSYRRSLSSPLPLHPPPKVSSLEVHRVPSSCIGIYPPSSRAY